MESIGKYAVIETGGQQFVVRKDEVHKIQKLEGEAGTKIEFDRVLLIGGEGDMKIGTPTVPDAKVSGEILEQARDTKIRIFKYKRRKKYRRRQGHRQDITYVKITDIP